MGFRFLFYIVRLSEHEHKLQYEHFLQDRSFSDQTCRSGSKVKKQHLYTRVFAVIEQCIQMYPKMSFEAKVYFRLSIFCIMVAFEGHVVAKVKIQTLDFSLGDICGIGSTPFCFLLVSFKVQSSKYSKEITPHTGFHPSISDSLLFHLLKQLCWLQIPSCAFQIDSAAFRWY